MQKENWKQVNFQLDFENATGFKLEVSNTGRLRSCKNNTTGIYLKGSRVNGYKIYKTTFYKPRTEKQQKHFDKLQKQIHKLDSKFWSLKREKANKAAITETTELLKKLRSKLSVDIKKNNKERAVHYSKLFHKLVAEYFLPKPKGKQVYVAHLDFNKNNNDASNLKWMTHQENVLHNKNNPKNIQKKVNGFVAPNAKLTKNKVVNIKKLLNEGKSLKELSKDFKVSDMQIHRIKTGENWGKVLAAE